MFEFVKSLYLFFCLARAGLRLTYSESCGFYRWSWDGQICPQMGDISRTSKGSYTVLLDGHRELLGVTKYKLVGNVNHNDRFDIHWGKVEVSDEWEYVVFPYPYEGTEVNSENLADCKAKYDATLGRFCAIYPYGAI